jgi:hypothetical protein
VLQAAGMLANMKFNHLDASTCDKSFFPYSSKSQFKDSAGYFALYHSSASLSASMKLLVVLLFRFDAWISSRIMRQQSTTTAVRTRRHGAFEKE